jgi:hypothetical protein
VLPAVSSSPQLDDLYLNFEDTIQDIPTFASDSFPELGELDIMAPIQMCINVITSLRLVASLQIWNLCLYLYDYSEEGSDSTLELAQSIQAVLSPTLKDLEISSWKSLDPRILQPLFECRRLEVVHISIHFDSKKRRSNSIAMARIAWPELYDLDLGTESGCPSSDSESEPT